jgi:hypothetical protein
MVTVSNVLAKSCRSCVSKRAKNGHYVTKTNVPMWDPTKTDSFMRLLLCVAGGCFGCKGTGKVFTHHESTDNIEVVYKIL